MLDNKLYSLPTLSVNSVNTPILIFTNGKDITEKLVVESYFIVQLYEFDGDTGMTTIWFGLDGFTEALGAYNKFCK